MLSKEIRRILKENKKWIDMFEKWDRTGIDPFSEKKVCFSIKDINHHKLKKIAKTQKISMSDIIDNLIEST